MAVEYDQRKYEIVERYEGTNRALIRFEDGEEKEVSLTKAGKVDRKCLRLNSPNEGWMSGSSIAKMRMNPDLTEKHNRIVAEVMDWGKPDWGDTAEVRRRLEWYFGTCTELAVKPLVSEMAMCLGIDRKRIWEIVNEVHLPKGLTTETKDLIKNFYNLIEIYFEANFLDGKIQPVVGIFYAKNNLGYKDQTETVITPNNPLSDVDDSRDVAKRYLEEMGDYRDE